MTSSRNRVSRASRGQGLEAARHALLRPPVRGVAVLLLAGVSLPRLAAGLAAVLSLLPKRKSPKKRRPAVWVPALRLRAPCGARPGGVCASPSAQQAHPIRLRLRSSPPGGATGAGSRNKDNQALTRRGESLVFRFSIWPVFPRPPPCGCAEERGMADQGSRCLSEGEFSETPPGPSTAGCPQRSGGTHKPGSPFLCFFLLAKQKKVVAAGRSPRPTTLSRGAPSAQTKTLSTYRQRLQAQAALCASPLAGLISSEGKRNP